MKLQNIYIRTTINKRYFVLERIKKKKEKRNVNLYSVQRVDTWMTHGGEQNFDATFLLSQGLTFINI